MLEHCWSRNEAAPTSRRCGVRSCPNRAVIRTRDVGWGGRVGECALACVCGCGRWGSQVPRLPGEVFVASGRVARACCHARGAPVPVSRPVCVRELVGVECGRGWGVNQGLARSRVGTPRPTRAPRGPRPPRALAGWLHAKPIQSGEVCRDRGGGSSVRKPAAGCECVWTGPRSGPVGLSPGRTNG